MASAVIMPKAGITVESCIIGEWKKHPGDYVAEGEVLFSYETDKACFDCESTAAGTLLEIFFGDGDEVSCLVNVCAIGNPGEDCSSLRPEGTSAPGAASGTSVSSVTAASDVFAAASVEGAGVSPRAKTLAAASGTCINGIPGTGPNGRIIERDVRNAIDNPPPAEPAASAESEYEEVRFSGIRRVISKSMHDSLSTMAQLTLDFSFDATSVLNYRKLLKDAEDERHGITVGDIILYGIAHSLKAFPDLNSTMIDDKSMRRYKHVNLGVAVDTPRGLMVPTVFDADRKSLLEISQEVKLLAAECRSGKINPDKLSGGTFTVTNLGSFGVEHFTPVINPPQVGILGVCTITDRVRKNADGSPGLYPAMNLSLTIDHRAIDGAPAARFMTEFCAGMENFTAMLTE